jgi:hypothetical protein
LFAVKARKVKLNRSLQDLDGQDWGEPTFDSYLVRECHRLRRVPLSALTTEDLRLLLGQQIGVEHLLPLALDRLEAEPLRAGDFYPGDLLRNVLCLPATAWQHDPPLRARVAAVARQALVQLASASDDDTIARMLREDVQHYVDGKIGE